MRYRTLAPAKVNLVLRVGPPRPDGFHDILSLMVPLDLADRIEVEVSARAGAVTCEAPGRPELSGPGNLAARARKRQLKPDEYRGGRQNRDGQDQSGEHEGEAGGALDRVDPFFHYVGHPGPPGSRRVTRRVSATAPPTPWARPTRTVEGTRSWTFRWA